MPAYFDSNVVLSIIKHESNAERASSLWNSHKERVTSILFEIECLTHLRRYHLQFTKKLPFDSMQRTQVLLADFLSTLEMRRVDNSIISIIRRETELSKCSSLDAIHLATALFFKYKSDTPFYLITFDQQMARVAVKVGLEVLDN